MSPRETRIESALRCAGRPLTRAELRAALSLAPTHATSFYELQGRLPFVETDERRWGLVERDVPGGLSAFREAVRVIQETACRMPSAAEQVVRQLGGVHRSWTREMVLSAYRVAKASHLAASDRGLRAAG